MLYAHIQEFWHKLQVYTPHRSNRSQIHISMKYLFSTNAQCTIRSRSQTSVAVRGAAFWQRDITQRLLSDSITKHCRGYETDACLRLLIKRNSDLSNRPSSFMHTWPGWITSLVMAVCVGDQDNLSLPILHNISAYTQTTSQCCALCGAWIFLMNLWSLGATLLKIICFLSHSAAQPHVLQYIIRMRGRKCHSSN